MTQQIPNIHTLVSNVAKAANSTENSKINVVNHMYTFARGVGFIMLDHRGQSHTLSDRTEIKHDDFLSCVYRNTTAVRIVLLDGDNYLGGDNSGINKLCIVVDWSNLSFKFATYVDGKYIKISEQKSLNHFEGAWKRISELNGIDY